MGGEYPRFDYALMRPAFAPRPEAGGMSGSDPKRTSTQGLLAPLGPSVGGARTFQVFRF